MRCSFLFYYKEIHIHCAPIRLSFSVNQQAEQHPGHGLPAGLTLEYEAPWPVNLVLHPKVLKQCQEIFHFLLEMRQAKWALDNIRPAGA